MKDPYCLVRALEVILSLNDSLLQPNGLQKAKEVAAKGLSKYNAGSDTLLVSIDSLIKELQQMKLELS